MHRIGEGDEGIVTRASENNRKKRNLSKYQSSAAALSLTRNAFRSC